MKKRIISILFVVFFCIVLITPAMAEEETKPDKNRTLLFNAGYSSTGDGYGFVETLFNQRVNSWIGQFSLIYRWNKDVEEFQGHGSVAKYFGKNFRLIVGGETGRWEEYGSHTQVGSEFELLFDLKNKKKDNDGKEKTPFISGLRLNPWFRVPIFKRVLLSTEVLPPTFFYDKTTGWNLSTDYINAYAKLLWQYGVEASIVFLDRIMLTPNLVWAEGNRTITGLDLEAYIGKGFSVVGNLMWMSDNWEDVVVSLARNGKGFNYAVALSWSNSLYETGRLLSLLWNNILPRRPLALIVEEETDEVKNDYPACKVKWELEKEVCKDKPLHIKVWKEGSGKCCENIPLIIDPDENKIDDEISFTLTDESPLFETDIIFTKAINCYKVSLKGNNGCGISVNECECILVKDCVIPPPPPPPCNNCDPALPSGSQTDPTTNWDMSKNFYKEEIIQNKTLCDFENREARFKAEYQSGGGLICVSRIHYLLPKKKQAVIATQWNASTKTCSIWVVRIEPLSSGSAGEMIIWSPSTSPIPMCTYIKFMFADECGANF